MKEKDLEGIRFGLYIQIGKDTEFDKMDDEEDDGDGIYETLEEMGYTDEDMEDHYILYDLDDFGYYFDTPGGKEIVEEECLYNDLNDYLENQFGGWCISSYDYTIHPIIEGEIMNETMDYFIDDENGYFHKSDVIENPLWKTLIRNKKLEVLGL